jgi:hypothetical protein
LGATSFPLDIPPVSDIPVWNGILTFVLYMGVAGVFMPIRPSTDFIGDKRQGFQVWFSFHSGPIFKLIQIKQSIGSVVIPFRNIIP